MESKEPELKCSLSGEEILRDYRIVVLSRQLSILGRKEVHLGRAPFGIFGDGKELAQVAYVKNFRPGDWRSGYYRDQTFLLAAGMLTPVEFFAQLYGDTSSENNPSTGGRNFNNHHSTPNRGADGSFLPLASMLNSAADLSPTAGQMPRLLGLAQASKLVREHPEYLPLIGELVSGNEVAFGSIGESSTSEGMFFETINAACVMQIPLAMAIWDNGFGISVPVELQTAKGSISKVLEGFRT
ncbi:MAG: transketolase, partial [Marinilabiliales bacterium]|nr:transketolase [Marinilabiliales bacterium]